MEKPKKLPDAEYEVMKVLWRNQTPMTTSQIVALLVDDMNWAHQTVLTLLSRLCNRGFLSGGKGTKERFFEPLISEDEYLQAETERFVKTLRDSSVKGFMNAMFGGKKPSEKELEALRKWMKEMKQKDGDG